MGRRLRGSPLVVAGPLDGCGMPRPPRRGVVDALPLIEDDEVSLLILLEDACRGVIEPDFGVVVPDLGVVPPDDTLPAAEDGDNSDGLPSSFSGIN